MQGGGRRIASDWRAYGVAFLVLVTLAMLSVAVVRRPRNATSKVVIGSNDLVYYSSGVTSEDATALGRALEAVGFFRGQGASVLLSRHRSSLAIVSFVVNEGAWDSPNTIATFEEIGRHIAASVGGFPIEVRLVDSTWGIRKSLAVGKTLIGARDTVYYFGAATDADAQALGQALREAGYLQDLGVSVAVSKGDRTTLGFVVGEGVWERPDAVAAFARLARRVAPSIGGSPIELHLLNAEMQVQREAPVE